MAIEAAGVIREGIIHEVVHEKACGWCLCATDKVKHGRRVHTTGLVVIAISTTVAANVQFFI